MGLEKKIHLMPNPVIGLASSRSWIRLFKLTGENILDRGYVLSSASFIHGRSIEQLVIFFLDKIQRNITETIRGTLSELESLDFRFCLLQYQEH